MIIQNIDIPDDLLKAFEENRVVVFAGAGVSMQSPSNCPSFSDLADRIAGIKIYQHTLIIHNLNTDSELFSKFTAIQVGRVILLMLNHYSPDAQWILHGVDNLFKKNKSSHRTTTVSRNLQDWKTMRYKYRASKIKIYLTQSRNVTFLSIASRPD